MVSASAVAAIAVAVMIALEARHGSVMDSA